MLASHRFSSLPLRGACVPERFRLRARDLPAVFRSDRAARARLASRLGALMLHSAQPPSWRLFVPCGAVFAIMGASPCFVLLFVSAVSVGRVSCMEPLGILSEQAVWQVAVAFGSDFGAAPPSSTFVRFRQVSQYPFKWITMVR